MTEWVFDEHDAAMAWHWLGDEATARIKDARRAECRRREDIIEHWAEYQRRQRARRKLFPKWQRSGASLSFDEWLVWTGARHDDL